MRRLRLISTGMALSALAAASATAAACGSTTDDDPFKSTGDASTETGSGGTGGTSSGGSGGSSGATTGGAGGVGATGGSGGSAPDSGDRCAAPTDTTQTALCLKLAAEAITFVPTDPALDGSGIAFVQIFDRPDPDAPGVQPIAEALIPTQPDGGGLVELSLTDLALQGELRFEGLPGTVYARAVFADNPAFLENPGQGLTYGVWIGGLDLSQGLRESIPLDPISLVTGQGTFHMLTLTALRRMRVTVNLASTLTPADDGQGPATALAFRTDRPTQATPTFGVAQAACVDATAGPFDLEGVAVGSGDFWLTAVVNDFNTGGGFDEGDLVSVILQGTTATLPAQNKLSVGATAYSVSHSVELNTLLPVTSTPAPQAFACPAADAGVD